MPLVRAILVLVRAWIAQGKPAGRRRLGTFETWSSVVGGILEVAGIPGFLENLQALYETADVEGESWRAFVAAWWESTAESPRKVSDLNNLCEERELLLGVRGDGSPRSQQTRLGNALMSKRDRVFGGVRIVKVGLKGKENCVHYALVHNEADADAEPAIEARTSGTGENLDLQVLPHGSRPESPIPTGDSAEARTCENLPAAPRHMQVQAGAQVHVREEQESLGRFSQVLVEHATGRNDSELVVRTSDGQVLTGPPQVLAEDTEVLAEPPGGTDEEQFPIDDLDLANFGDEWESVVHSASETDEHDLDSSGPDWHTDAKRPIGLKRF